MVKSAAPAPTSSSRGTPVVAALLVAAVIASFSNGLRGVFVLDDVGSVLDNPTLLHPLSLSVLNPPHGGLTVSGRPVLNASLALNHALSGTAVWSYHAVNILLHAVASLLLYFIVRRVLSRRGFEGADLVAGLSALLWAVHPLQTETVTYIVQRAEGLMSVAFLAAFYAFLRAIESPRPARWYAACSVAFLLALGTKENAVALVPLLFLYEIAVEGSAVRDVLRNRGVFYAAFAVGGLGIAGALAVYGGRGGLVGLGAEGTPLSYALTQPGAILTYLRLSVIPYPLVFEYGILSAPGGLVLGFQGLVLAGLVAGVAIALFRAPLIGFCGAWFFLILAPTSLVPGTTQMIVEHRMYLPLAAVVSLGVAAGYRYLGARACTWGAFAVALGFSVLTILRNEDYRSEVRLWSDTVAKRPNNTLAHHNLGTAFAKLPGHEEEALREYRRAIDLTPNLAVAHKELGELLLRRPAGEAEALAQFREAVRLDPKDPEARTDLGRLLARSPETRAEAVLNFREAVRLDPRSALAHVNLGEALRADPSLRDEAKAEYEAALALDASSAEAHNGLGVMEALVGRDRADAEEHFRTALRLRPEFAEAHFNLGLLLSGEESRQLEAIAELREAIAERPGFAEAHNALGRLWSLEPSMARAAIDQFREALALNPDYAEAHFNLGNVLLGYPQALGDAISEYEAALRLRPDYVDAHHNLAAALLRIPGRQAEARAHLEVVVRLHPADLEARRAYEALGGEP